MRYLSTTRGTDSNAPPTTVQRLLGGLLTKILPRANPDFDDKYSLVRTWWLEVSDETGEPEREIGFDHTGVVIVAGPIGENIGFWLDTQMTFDATDGESVERSDFEAAWQTFVEAFVRPS